MRLPENCAIRSYPCRLRTFPGTSRIMFGALGLRVISTLLGLLFRSTPLKVSIFTTFLAGEEGTLNLPILHHSYLYGVQGCPRIQSAGGIDFRRGEQAVSSLRRN